MMNQLLCAVAVALATLAITPTLSHAQARDLVTRRELIRRAQAASDAGRHDEALDLAQRAAQIESTPSLRAFTVRELRATGRIVEALSEAEQCTREAAATATLPDRAAILALCRETASALASQVAHITVHVPSSAPSGLEVTVAGSPLRAALFDVPYVVTPGAIEVRADGPGVQPFVRDVHLDPGGATEVTVHLDPLPPGVALPAVRVAPLAPTPMHSSTTAPAGPVAMLAGGVAAFGVTIAWRVAADGAFATFERQQCGPIDVHTCHDTLASHQQHDAAVGLDTATWVTFGVALAFTLGGTVWWALLPAHVRDRVHPAVSLTGREGVVGVAGAF